MVYEWIITDAGLIDKVIIDNKTPVTDIPAFQLSKRLSSIDESLKDHCKKIKKNDLCRIEGI